MYDNKYQLNNKMPAELILGAQTKQLLTIGEQNKWDCQIIGQAPMLTKTVRVRDYLLVPAQFDSTPLPDHAMERVRCLFEAGIRPQGFVLVHEAPLQLKAPKPVEKSKVKKDNLGKIGGAALGLGVLTGSLVAAVGVVILGSLLILPAGLLAAAVIIDPILIAVMPDDSWVEIDRWDIQ